VGADAPLAEGDAGPVVGAARGIAAVRVAGAIGADAVVVERARAVGLALDRRILTLGVRGAVGAHAPFGERRADAVVDAVRGVAAERVGVTVGADAVVLGRADAVVDA